MRKIIALSLAVLFPAVLLAGCQTVLLTGGAAVANIFDRPDVNLAEKNYAAADYLMQAGGNFVHKQNDDIKVAALQNIAEPQLSTRIGRVIAKQTGERLQQLGYRVDLEDVSAPVENDIPFAAPGPGRNEDYVLTGTYRNSHSKVDVKLRLVDARNSRAVAQFDYSLPMSYEIQNMTRPKPKIYRTTGTAQQQQFN